MAEQQKEIIQKKQLSLAMLCGILGCFCYGGGDWLMMYGDSAHTGSLIWLTQGTAQIAAWRNGLAMALPASVLYYDLICICMDEREWVSGHGTSCMRSVVCTPVLDDLCK